MNKWLVGSKQCAYLLYLQQFLFAIQIKNFLRICWWRKWQTEGGWGTRVWRGTWCERSTSLAASGPRGLVMGPDGGREHEAAVVPLHTASMWPTSTKPLTRLQTTSALKWDLKTVTEFGFLSQGLSESLWHVASHTMPQMLSVDAFPPPAPSGQHFVNSQTDAAIMFSVSDSDQSLN